MSNPTVGIREIAKTARRISVSADGNPRRKPGGVTIDWASVPVVNGGADVTWPDGLLIKAGKKAIRYGTVVCKLNASEADTLTLNATGGTYTLGVAVDGGTVQNTGALAFNANAAAIQAALVALTNVGTGNVAVTGTNPFTITFAGGTLAGHQVVVTSNPASLTGGTSTAALVETAAGAITEGFFAPYAAGAINGRQLLVRGECFIADETVHEDDFKSEGLPGGAIDGGLLFLARVANDGVSLTTNPTRSQIEAAFPVVDWVED